MKTKHFISFITLASAFISTSCLEDAMEARPHSSQSLNIMVKEANFNLTRATYSGFSTTFVSGDKIGLYVVNGSSVVNANAQYTYNGSEWSTPSDIEYNDSYTYYAYYPYTASPYTPDFTQSGVDNIFSLFLNDASNKFHAIDQSTNAKYTACDLMIAQGTLAGENTVTFSMYHKKGLAVFKGAASSATFTGNLPYLQNSYKYFLMKPSIETSFTDDGGTYTLTAPSGKYVTHTTKLSLTYTAPTAKSLTYTGSEQVLLNAGSATGGILQYSSDNSSWSTTIPSGITAGNYLTYWRIVGNENYQDKASERIDVSIAKASRTLSFTTAPTTVGVGATETVAATPSAGEGDGSITYTASPTSVATVNATTGVVTGVSDGTVTITATVAEGTNYLSATNTHNITVENYNVVDLGLPSGVLWAKGNIIPDGSGGYKIGEESDWGAYVSWGNVTPHFSSNGSSFDDSYNWGSTNDGVYASTSGASVAGSGTTGAQYAPNSGYDAARELLGGKWRMPTDVEFQELIDNCTSTWATINGVYGRMFTSRITGYTDKYVFFPATGCGSSANLSSRGTFGMYWSSSLNPGDSGAGYDLYFNSSSVSRTDYSRRSYGLAVRAVVKN